VGVAIIVTGSPDSSNLLSNIFWNRKHEPKSLGAKKKICVSHKYFILYFISLVTSYCQGLLVGLYANKSE